MFDQQLDLYGQAHDIAPTHEQPRMFEFPTNLRGQTALETDRCGICGASHNPRESWCSSYDASK